MLPAETRGKRRTVVVEPALLVNTIVGLRSRHKICIEEGIQNFKPMSSKIEMRTRSSADRILDIMDAALAVLLRYRRIATSSSSSFESVRQECNHRGPYRTSNAFMIFHDGEKDL